MDCFYAAIEMRDNPALKNQPIAVGGRPDSRGVLCTANYLARKWGVGSAMSSARALRICPDLIIVPVDFNKYRAVAQQIREIFYEYTEKVEPLSLDEAYLDVTACPLEQNSATWMAQAICRKIYNTQELTASAGVAPNKFLAKVASDWRKPNGIFVIPPRAISTFIPTLPVGKIFGVGKVTQEKMLNLGIKTCADLQNLTKLALCQHFGTFGERLYDLARGMDTREVNPDRIRKSLSVETTFNQDITHINQCDSELESLYEELKRRLATRQENPIYKQFVKIKFHDFTKNSAENLSSQLDFEKFKSLMQQAYQRAEKPIRLLGIGVRFKIPEPMGEQMDLWV